MFNLAWVPPGVLPPEQEFALRSTRGFLVAPGAPTSAMGISVVLVPASATPPLFVTYVMKDPITSAALRRPWKVPAITLPPTPGVVTYAGIQVTWSTGPVTQIISPATCAPRPE